jgi:hypothetical protein
MARVLRMSLVGRFPNRLVKSKTTLPCVQRTVGVVADDREVVGGEIGIGVEGDRGEAADHDPAVPLHGDGIGEGIAPANGRVAEVGLDPAAVAKAGVQLAVRQVARQDEVEDGPITAGAGDRARHVDVAVGRAAGLIDGDGISRDRAIEDGGLHAAVAEGRVEGPRDTEQGPLLQRLDDEPRPAPAAARPRRAGKQITPPEARHDTLLRGRSTPL